MAASLQSTLNRSDEEYVATFKIVLLGHTGVGKTSLLSKYTTGEFRHTLMTTIGLDFKHKVIDVDGVCIRLRIWDTAGQERFETLTSQYIRGAQGIILVFDLTQVNSYERLLKWLHETINVMYSDVPVVVVGNKSDLKDQRCVNLDVHSGQVNVSGRNYRYFETSCVTGHNIDKMFLAIGRLLAQHNNLYNPGVAARLLAKQLSLISTSDDSSRGSLVVHDVPEDINDETHKKCCS